MSWQALRLCTVAIAIGASGCAPPSSTPQQSPTWVADTSSYSPGSPSAGAPAAPTATSAVPSPTAAPAGTGIAERYRDAVDRIIAAARADRDAYKKLAHLTDRIGARLSGSAALERAIAWAAQTMKDEGHDVRTEKVMVPHWVRGAESAELVAPVARPLHVLGLGGTAPTPVQGITAPVVVVRDWAELEAKAAQVKGAIVLFNVAMPAWTVENGSGYGGVAQYRGLGPSRAAKLGAVAMLMRSVTAHSLSTPHTGALRYEDGVPKIPALAVTVEDAALIARLAEQGTVTVRVRAASKQLPDAESANVIGELRGRGAPSELVVIGAHIDSWDVGQGAHDDGAGVVVMMQAITTLRKLNLIPRRTIRVVLFTNEENGLRGGREYAKVHAAELPNTVLALESDSGGFAPRGFSVQAHTPEAQERVRARVAEIAALLKPIDATRVETGGSGSDIAPMVPAGVPALGLDVDNRTYFDIHHTAADTLDKVDPAALAANVAAVAALAYVVADMPGRVDAP